MNIRGLDDLNELVDFIEAEEEYHESLINVCLEYFEDLGKRYPETLLGEFKCPLTRNIWKVLDERGYL